MNQEWENVQTMKVYVVIEDSVDDTARIYGVFSSAQLAAAWRVANLNGAEDAGTMTFEMTLDKPGVEEIVA